MSVNIRLIWCLLIFSMSAFSQKPAIDTSVFTKWPSTNRCYISNNGQYVAYIIGFYATWKPSEQTLVFRSIKDKWEQKFTGGDNVSFSDDSRKGIFIIGDSLCIITLGSSVKEFIPGVSAFQLYKHGSYRMADIPGKQFN